VSQENVELVRRGVESFNRWAAEPDAEPNPEMGRFLHPDVEYHTYPDSPEAGVYRGADEVIRYFQRLFGAFESVRIELDEVLAAGDHVAVISRQHAVPKGGQATMVVPVVEVWKIRDGLCAGRRSFATRREALKAVGLEE
jgi:ketosteroid isomerase-like protein